MMYNARNERIRVNNTDCDYITFGSGDKPLIMLPGVGDGFKTARGVAIPFAMMYRNFAKDFKVYVFSRRNDLPEDFTTRDMADDLSGIMDKLGIGKACVFGVSHGGMIAEQLAIDHPDKVDCLILAVTAARPNKILMDSILTWLDMADKDDYKGIVVDTAKRSYTGAYLKRGLITNKVLSVFKPKDYSRFRVLCRSCLQHDVYDELDRITCPTLIIAGDDDKTVGNDAPYEMSERISDCELHIYEGLGHSVFEEAGDFYDRVLAFCDK